MVGGETEKAVEEAPVEEEPGITPLARARCRQRKRYQRLSALKALEIGCGSWELGVVVAPRLVG